MLLFFYNSPANRIIFIYMNIVNREENKFEKVVETNPLYTIFETKAVVDFKKGERIELYFDEISNIRLVKKVTYISLLSFILVFTFTTALCVAYYETNSSFQLAYLLFSLLCFILIFYVKKRTYELYINQKNLVYHKFEVKKEMLADVKFFVKTIREIKRQNRKKSVN